MAENNIIAVFGATGAQGGGLVRAILDDPGGGFTARALTRDPTSEKGAALAEMGAEVVRADIDAATLVERMGERGVLAVNMSSRSIRLVTHLDVSATQVDQACEHIAAAVRA